jgi:arylsulfatase A-like enzyme
MRYFNLILSLCISAVIMTCHPQHTDNAQTGSPASGKPNVVIIIPDDLGWHDVGYNGSSVMTPNIDKLASAGVRLDQHYVMPTCTPTRVSLMTGRYPSRYGILGPDYGEVIDMGDPTLASVLADNGYSTHISGKWHMGSPPYTPLKYGFQTSYGYFDGQIDPYTHEYKQETPLTDRRSWHRNDEYLDEEGHATDLITQEALRVIESGSDKPFFLYVAYSVPHFPLDEPDEWMHLYDDVALSPSRRWFAASVSHMDYGIGQIVEALQRSGKIENTLLLFISDNGGQHSWYSDTEYRGKYAAKPHRVLGNNFPLRGWKGDLYEGGIRVPALVHWPAGLKSGVVDRPVHVSDWLPTICEIVGCTDDLPVRDIDGQSVLPVLEGEDITGGHSMYWKTRAASAVRDGKWKLLVHHQNAAAELYDLENDFRESRDLSGDEPEVLKRLLDLLESFRARDRE